MRYTPTWGQYHSNWVGYRNSLNTSCILIIIIMYFSLCLDDAMKDSEETATAFTVSHNSRKNFSLQIHESKSKSMYRSL